MTADAFRSVLEDILEVPRGSLRDSDSRETLKSWSSLADVQILVAIASELGIDPDPSFLEIDTIGGLFEKLRREAPQG